MEKSYECVARIDNTLPLICESFNGKYIEMDFSENRAIYRNSNSRTRISQGNNTLWIVQFLNQGHKSTSTI